MERKMKDIPLKAKVEGTDGHVGEVDDLVRDPDSGEITYVVMREGHLWGKRDVTLPVSAIDRVEDDKVYLNLDKKEVELLPSIPVKDQDKDRPVNVELVAKVFDNTKQATEALDFVEDLHKRKTIKILNAAVLVKEEDGTTSLVDTRDIEPKKGRLLGAVTGGLIGLVGGPAGVVAGALIGAGAGHVAAKGLDFGFSDKFLENLQEHLQPGSSALVILVEDTWAISLSESLKDDKGIVLQQTITDELVKEFEGDDEEGE
jgi:uncharacterized membrane protein